MKPLYFLKVKLFLFRSILILVGSSAYAISEAEVRTKLQEFEPITSIQERIEKFSALFLGTPFGANLGEGENAEFVQRPLYSFESFDCVTYVETVLALALSRNWEEFQTHLNLIRYNGGVVAYERRNHFPETDWIPNLITIGFAKDITQQVYENALFSHAITDKKNWYSKKSTNDLYLPNLTGAEKDPILSRLQNLGDSFSSISVSLPYVPLTAVYRDNPDLLDRIPSASIMSVVRVGWKIKDIIGSDLIVSHHGFLISTDKGLMLRHARINSKVVEIPVLEYFKNNFEKPESTSIRGFHLLVMTESK